MRGIRWVSLVCIALIALAALPAHAAAQDFYFTEFDADYYLGIDSEKRSTLKTVESITAVFPDLDQNHGMERVIPKSYDGHSTHVLVKSVTDKAGASLPYTTSNDENDNLVVRIGDANIYVHGEQTYKITYTQRDVTKYFKDTNDDEFYWDTNGVEWLQPFNSVVARVRVADNLQQYLTANKSCVYGANGSETACFMEDISPGEFTASVPRVLAPGENMTVAVGFMPGTFAQYEPNLVEKITGAWFFAQIILLPASFVGFIVFIIRYYRFHNRTNELGTIAPEYTPPRDISVTTAAQLTDIPRSVMAAQLLDLAVRHYVKIYEVKEKKLFSSAEYEVEIAKNPADLRWEEKELLSDSFGKLPVVGERLNLKTLKSSTSYYSRTLNNDKDLRKLVRGEYGLRTKRDELNTQFKRVSGVLLIFGLLVVSPFVLALSGVVFGLSFALWPLTDKGLALKRYLKGLEMYIKLAEVDRLSALQSPDGVEKVGADVGEDVKKRLQLYEKTLPYAVLFGQEKNWNKQLGKYYEQAGTQPSWYNSQSGAFHAASFGTAMNSFSSATNYASSSSSSSGGSGGGSSGGGGGGGGGGGW